MDQAKCLELIDLYKQRVLLWNPKEKLYYNKKKRHDAWCEISNLMSTPIPELKEKMKTLMGTFRSEKSKEKKSNRSGSQDAYTSKWFAFKSFEFLMDRDQTRDTLDFNQAAEESILTPGGENENHSSLVTSYLTGETAYNKTEAMTQTTATSKKAASKRKRELVGRHPCEINEVFHPMKSSAGFCQDPYNTYGMHVASELRKFDRKTQAYIKKGIADLFFEAEMGLIHSGHDPVFISPSLKGHSSAASNASWTWNEEYNSDTDATL